MLEQALKKVVKDMVNEMQGCPNKKRTDKIDQLWLVVESLIADIINNTKETEKELKKNAWPHLRKRNNKKDPAYLAVRKALKLIKEMKKKLYKLDGNT